MASLVTARALVDYARRPLNLVLLVLVPVVIVFVWGARLADFAEILGGEGDRPQIEAATAGWSAAALAGLAGFFQVTGSRAADRRLVFAAGRTAPVVVGRLVGALGLGLLAAAGGLVALAVRTGIDDPLRAIAATVGIGVIYLSIGVVVGTLVRSEMNGALVVTLLWVFDVILGPALGPGTAPLLRIFPLHYPTLVLTDRASGHAGPAGDVGWTVVWVAVVAVVAVVRLVRTMRPVPAAARGPAAVPVVSVPVAPARAVAAAPAPSTIGHPDRRSVAVLRAGMRDHRRNRVLWVLLVSVPALFIGMAVATTVDVPGPVDLVEGSDRFTAQLSERRMHAATMVPVTAAFLAGITGLFVVTGSPPPTVDSCRPATAAARCSSAGSA